MLKAVFEISLMTGGFDVAVGVDIDGTVCDFITAAVMVFNRVLDRSVSVDDAYARYSLGELYGLTTEEFDILLQVHGSEIYASAMPFPRAQAMTCAWSAAGEQVVYITTRPWEYHTITRTWLRRWNFPVGNIFHVRTTAEKGTLARLLGVSTLVDDHPDVFQSCRTTPGLNVIVASQPYNLALPATRRVNWADLMKGDAIENDGSTVAI